MQRTLAQLILLSSTAPPLIAPLVGGVSPGAGDSPPCPLGKGPGESSSQICCVHMPSGGGQMLQLALQQVSPEAQLIFPQAAPGADSATSERPVAPACSAGDVDL